MKKLFSFLPLFLTFFAHAQNWPAIETMTGVGGPGRDSITKRITMDEDGGFIVHMATTSAASPGNINAPCLSNTSGAAWADVFRKYNAYGDAIVWEHCFFNDTERYNYYFPLPGGDRILAGNVTTPQQADQVLVMRLNAAGNTVWRKTYGGTEKETLVDMVLAADGNLIMLAESRSADGDVGAHYGSSFNANLWIVKLNANGDILWNGIAGGAGRDRATCIAAAPDGGCYAMGNTESTTYDCTGNHSTVYEDIFVVRFDGAGTKKWAKCLGGTGQDGWFANGCGNGSGGLLLTAYTSSEDGDMINNTISNGWQTWLAELDSNGGLLRNKFVGDSSAASPGAICRAMDGSLWLGGRFFYSNELFGMNFGKSDGWLLHLDANWNIMNTRPLRTKGSDEVLMLHPLPAGRVMVSGVYGEWNPNAGMPNTWYGENDVFLATINQWPTGVSEYATSGQVQVHPNPATDHITITTTTKETGIVINDLAGRPRYRHTITGSSLQIDTRHWPRGMYLIQLNGSDGSRRTEKLVLQ